MKAFALAAVEVFAALLTPTIGLITTYIAIRQYYASEDAVRRELLDRRLSVYKSCMAFLARSVQRAPDQDSTHQFLRETADAFYLFRAEIEAYLDEIYRNAIKFECNSKILDGGNLPIGDRRTQLALEHENYQQWFGQQLAEAKNKFKPYLAIHG